MLKLLGRANSVNVQKVLWTCEELAVASDREDLGGRFGGRDSSACRRKNRNGMVPTIGDGGLVLGESNATVRYRAARYGCGSLWPTDPVERATSDKWMDRQLTTFWPQVRTSDHLYRIWKPGIPACHSARLSCAMSCFRFRERVPQTTVRRSAEIREAGSETRRGAEPGDDRE